MAKKHFHFKDIKFLYVAVLALGILNGCSDSKDDEYVERPVEELYNKAYVEMKNRDFVKAAKSFNEVERQHPYSQWAIKAQIMSAYSYYEAQKYEDAIEGLETFIELHPGNENIAYAYYLLALSYYEQISTVDRDQKMTELAMVTFEELLRRYPNTKYAKDAKYKLDLTRDHLAGKEMEIGRFYQSQHLSIAALNRFKKVLDKFQTTNHIPEALHRMVESYLTIGIKDEALATASVLKHNFPRNQWTADTLALLAKDDLKPIQRAIPHEDDESDEAVSEEAAKDDATLKEDQAKAAAHVAKPEFATEEPAHEAEADDQSAEDDADDSKDDEADKSEEAVDDEGEAKDDEAEENIADKGEADELEASDETEFDESEADEAEVDELEVSDEPAIDLDEMDEPGIDEEIAEDWDKGIS